MKNWLNSLQRSTNPTEIYANRYIIALTVTLACILELLDTSIINVAIPHMMGTLGATIDEIAWVSTGYVVANVIVLPISGWLSAYFGRRNYFAASIILFTIASFACGNATSLGGLVFWRIVQGIGGGGLLSTAQSTLYETFPPKEAGTAMAIFGMGIMVGPTLGPTVGGYITDAFSWPWIFYINIPFGILALLLTLLYLPDSQYAQKAEKVDYIGLILLTIGIGALQTMLERGEKLDWFDSREIITYAVLSASSLAVLVWHELRVEHPIIDFRILKDSQFSSALVFTFLLGFALFSTLFIFPVYLQTLLNYNAWNTGLVILPGALATAFAMAAMGKMTNSGKANLKVLIIIGLGLFGYSMWQHAHFTDQNAMEDFLSPLILRGIGLGMIFIPLNHLALANISLTNMPNATGLYNLTRQLGGSVGIALSATLLVQFQQKHHSHLIQYIHNYSDIALERLTQIQSMLLMRGTPATEVQAKALALLNGHIGKQALMLSFEQLFMLFGISLIATLPLLLLMKHQRVTASDSLIH